LNKYVYTFVSKELLQCKDLDGYERFVVEDVRYDVEFGDIREKVGDNWHQDVVLTLQMEEPNSIDQEGANIPDLLDRFPELYQICHDQAKALNETKETFRNEVRAKALMSSPL
jgi:hypothetical protein